MASSTGTADPAVLAPAPSKVSKIWRQLEIMEERAGTRVNINMSQEVVDLAEIIVSHYRETHGIKISRPQAMEHAMKSYLKAQGVDFDAKLDALYEKLSEQ